MSENIREAALETQYLVAGGREHYPFAPCLFK